MSGQAFQVKPGAAAERLDVYLAAAMSRPRSQVLRLIQAGSVSVNGQAGARPSYQMQAGDLVEVREVAALAAKPKLAPNLEVVYEDADILVVDKPAGLSTHPGAGSELATVADFARLHTTDPDPDRPGIVHRLDRDTSGLLVIAKTEPAKAFMQAAFKAHKVQKTYRLLVVGRLEPETAVIRLPLGRDTTRPLRQAVSAGGREAITAYRAMSYYPGYTLLEAHPKTGRTHQLRVHFAATGHPIAGDITYGGSKRPLGLKRQFLHAAALEFSAPSGQVLRLESPLAKDLAEVLSALEVKAARP